MHQKSQIHFAFWRTIFYIHSDVMKNILYGIVAFCTRATCMPYLIRLIRSNFSIRSIVQNSEAPRYATFLLPPLNSSLVTPHIPDSNLYSNNFSLCASLKVCD